MLHHVAEKLDVRAFIHWLLFAFFFCILYTCFSRQTIGSDYRLSSFANIDNRSRSTVADACGCTVHRRESCLRAKVVLLFANGVSANDKLFLLWQIRPWNGTILDYHSQSLIFQVYYCFCWFMILGQCHIFLEFLPV